MLEQELALVPVIGSDEGVQDVRWPPKLRQVAMRESCFYKRLRNRSSQ